MPIHTHILAALVLLYAFAASAQVDIPRGPRRVADAWQIHFDTTDTPSCTSQDLQALGVELCEAEEGESFSTEAGLETILLDTSNVLTNLDFSTVGTAPVATGSATFTMQDVLQPAEIDTYSELNTIVADATLVHNGLIDTLSKLETIMGSIDIIEATEIDTVDELNAIFTSDKLAKTYLGDAASSAVPSASGDFSILGGDGITCLGASNAITCALDDLPVTQAAFDAITWPLWALAFDYGSTITTDQEWVLPSWPQASTVTRCDCEAYGGTSFTVNICLGEDTGDDTCATAVASGLVCDTTGASATGLSQNLTARQELTAVVTAVSGAVAKGTISCDGPLQ